MPFVSKFQAGKFKNPYEFALRLASKDPVDTTSFVNLKDRGFTIYRWETLETKFARKYYSGYKPFLYHNPVGNWTKYDDFEIKGKHIGKSMMGHHEHFRNLEEFKKWLGTEAAFSELLVDIL